MIKAIVQKNKAKANQDKFKVECKYANDNKSI